MGSGQAFRLFQVEYLKDSLKKQRKCFNYFSLMGKWAGKVFITLETNLSGYFGF